MDFKFQINQKLKRTSNVRNNHLKLKKRLLLYLEMNTLNILLIKNDHRKIPLKGNLLNLMWYV